ncbi:uncharacterized protein At5g01610-like [Gastrolobium bilobum]|uniref:uncharacterized protein At5g01610-like n=1 Tax=Gastrolobium bilobum TaxID=150636 RepID=UPI002AB0569F|nr:uncharacterized protein At5g01610-like [Gastrolobium bilobum]
MHQTKVSMRSLILFLSVVACATYAHALRGEQENLSAYDILEQYDLPVGLLPKGVTGYELNERSGKFKAYLNDTCIFKIRSYELKYKTTISGVISKGSLAKLKGITVRIEVLWLRIMEVTRQGDEIEFSVLGLVSADFSVNSFSESPQCGCGFHCNNFQIKGDVSSI